MGMMADSSRINLVHVIHQDPLKPPSATIPRLRTTMTRKRNLERRLISRSSLPTLVKAGFEFIWARVSMPVNTIIPSTWPLDANTVLAHKVCSKLRASRWVPDSSLMSSLFCAGAAPASPAAALPARTASSWLSKYPLKSYIRSLGAFATT